MKADEEIVSNSGERESRILSGFVPVGDGGGGE